MTAIIVGGSTWGLAYAGYLPAHSAQTTPPPPVVTVSSVQVHISYANQSNQYLGGVNQSGCQYENCPFELSYVPNGFNLPSSGTMNLELLCSICFLGPGNHTAVVESVSSTPKGMTLISATPLLLVGEPLVWAGLIVQFPPQNANYTVNVQVMAT